MLALCALTCICMQWDWQMHLWLFQSYPWNKSKTTMNEGPNSHNTWNPNSCKFFMERCFFVRIKALRLDSFRWVYTARRNFSGSSLFWKLEVFVRPRKFNFSVIYIHVLPFYNICLLTYLHIKMFVRVDETENILHTFYKHSFFGSASVCLWFF